MARRSRFSTATLFAHTSRRASAEAEALREVCANNVAVENLDLLAMRPKLRRQGLCQRRFSRSGQTRKPEHHAFFLLRHMTHVSTRAESRYAAMRIAATSGLENSGGGGSPLVRSSRTRVPERMSR